MPEGMDSGPGPEKIDPKDVESYDSGRTPEQDELYDASLDLGDARERVGEINEGGREGTDAHAQFTVEQSNAADEALRTAQERYDAAHKAVLDAGQSVDFE